MADSLRQPGSFHFRLAANWKTILRRAWSVRLILLAGLLSGLEVALPLVRDVIEMPAGIFAALSLLTVSGAFIARLIAQKDLDE